MPYRTDVIYRYDGTFEGLLCCVFESFDKKEIPSEIIFHGTEQLSLYPVSDIETDPEKAFRVSSSIPKKISSEAFQLVCKGFLTCHPEKELLILNFLHLGFHYGGRIMSMLTNDTVNALFKAVHHLDREVHLFLGFVRFSIYGEVLVSTIEPKNIVLPLMKQHFCERFSQESFLIFDKTNHMALVYRKYKAEIIPVDDLTLPSATGDEEYYRILWKTFYDTIAIKERYNPKCRMTMMPKRYWKHMTEFSDIYPDQGCLPL